MRSTKDNFISRFNSDSAFLGKVIRNVMNLMLFLTVVWYFFTYGQNDLAVSDDMEIILYITNLFPILFIPIILWGINRLKSTQRNFVYNLLLLTAFGVLFFQTMEIWINPIFLSRWTWAYNDLRELNYIQPIFKIMAYMLFLILFLMDNKEIACEIAQIRSKDVKKSSQMRIIYAASILLAFLGWGILQGIFANQPIWISSTVLMNLIVVEIIFNIILQIGMGKAQIEGVEITQSPISSLPRTRKVGIFFIGLITFIGFTLFTIIVWLYPAQLVYQEGPSTPWSNTLFIGSGISAIILLIWWKKNWSASVGFMITVLGNLIAPLLISIGFNSVPGSVSMGLQFIGIGFVLLALWIIYYGNHGESRNSQGIQQWFLWVWGVSFLLLFNDPMLEIWEMEEGLIDILGPDVYGTGVGLYYGVIASVWLIVALVTFGIIILIKFIKRRSINPEVKVQESKAIITPSNDSSHVLPTNRIRTEIKAVIIMGLVAFSGCLILTTIQIQGNNPTIVSSIGDHGVLWLANSYDRVLPDYRPDFSNSPINSTIDIYAMRGETETIQLVFTPLASKMISFNYYEWYHNLTITKADNLWNGPGDETENISIELGRIGYLTAFDPNIADVILPFSPFITGDRKNIPFWLDIVVPNSTESGVYTTRFKIDTTSYLQRIARPASLNIDLRLTVWNITMPINHTFATCINYIPESNHNIDNLVNLGFKYGINFYGGAVPETYGRGEDMVEFDPDDLSAGIDIDWTRFDEVVERKLNEGMTQIILDFYPGIDCRHHPEYVLDGSKDNYLTIIQWFYENASEHLDHLYTPWGATWESITITQHSDEPDWRLSPYIVPAFTKLYTILNKSTQIRSFQTVGYEPIYAPWLGLLDIWVFTPNSYSIDNADLIREAGGEVWTYSNGDNFPGTDTDLRTPLMLSRLRGWVDFKYNVSGFLHWVFYWNYNDAGQSGSGYDGRGDGTEIVPFLDTYLPTLRLVAFRDSLEDYELLCHMIKILDNAVILGLTATAEYQNCLEIKNDIYSALSPQPADSKWSLFSIIQAFNHTPSLYIQLRAKLGNALNNLLSIM